MVHSLALHRRRALAVVALITVAVTGPHAAAESAGSRPFVRAEGAVTRLVSVSSDGRQTAQDSSDPVISSTGRFVAFTSASRNLVSVDANRSQDVFVRDRVSGLTQLASLSDSDQQVNSDSSTPAISGSGRFVAFVSAASNLVSTPDADRGADDVFVRDRQADTTQQVSTGLSGAATSKDSATPDFSEDGKFVAFESASPNLVDGDTNGVSDVFAWDRLTGSLQRVSVTSGGGQSDGPSFRPSISADGNFIAFVSRSSNLVPGSPEHSDIYLHSLVSGMTTRVSVPATGAATNAGSVYPTVSATGRFISFESVASNLVAGDNNEHRDVFLRDRRTGSTQRITVGRAGGEANASSYWPEVSADGSSVAFASAATNLVKSDTNARSDIFVWTRASNFTRRVSVGIFGREPNDRSWWPAVSGDGKAIVFESKASNLVRGDDNSASDVFIRVR